MKSDRTTRSSVQKRPGRRKRWKIFVKLHVCILSISEIACFWFLSRKQKEKEEEHEDMAYSASWTGGMWATTKLEKQKI